MVLGQGGDDTFYASAGSDNLQGGSGSDTIDYSGLDGAGSISVTLDGTNATKVTVSSGDNDSIRNIENVIGTSGNDTITGQ